MKSKLLKVLLILLVFLNGVLIFMLIKKPHENRRPNPHRNFLTEQLNFTESQKEGFTELDEVHRGFMANIHEKVREKKDALFTSFSDKNFNPDLISTEIGILEGKKEAEIFRFFSEVKKLCTQKQAELFDQIIEEAIKEGKRRPSNNGRMPPPEDGRHHPPR
jgi:hypothetical protein